MTQATHTRGPFGISRNATPDYAPQFSIYAETGNGNDLAIVKGDNAERDAALFAAAPDMLEALEAIEGYLHNHADRGDSVAMGMLRMARAAIGNAVQS